MYADAGSISETETAGRLLTCAFESRSAESEAASPCVDVEDVGVSSTPKSAQSESDSVSDALMELATTSKDSSTLA